MVDDKGTIITDRNLQECELLNYHDRSRKENSSIQPGIFESVTWDRSFSGLDARDI